jgi:hypothetical protein
MPGQCLNQNKDVYVEVAKVPPGTFCENHESKGETPSPRSRLKQPQCSHGKWRRICWPWQLGLQQDREIGEPSGEDLLLRLGTCG